MSKQIFTVFACDEWKSQDSMRLLMATTSIRKLASFIARKIADETFSYNKGESLSVSQQVKLVNYPRLKSQASTLTGVSFPT